MQDNNFYIFEHLFKKKQKKTSRFLRTQFVVIYIQNTCNKTRKCISNDINFNIICNKNSFYVKNIFMHIIVEKYMYYVYAYENFPPDRISLSSLLSL